MATGDTPGIRYTLTSDPRITLGNKTRGANNANLTTDEIFRSRVFEAMELPKSPIAYATDTPSPNGSHSRKKLTDPDTQEASIPDPPEFPVCPGQKRIVKIFLSGKTPSEFTARHEKRTPPPRVVIKRDRRAKALQIP